MYTYLATVVRVVDGDTIRLNVDLGFNLKHESNFRLLAVMAPEVVGAEAAAGAEWKAKLQELAPSGTLVCVQTHKPDKYGRWLAVLSDLAGGNINQALVDAMATKGTP